MDRVINYRLSKVLQQKNHTPLMRQKIRKMALNIIETREMAAAVLTVQIFEEAVTPLEVVTIIASMLSEEPGRILRVVVEYMNINLDKHCRDLYRASMNCSKQSFETYIQTLTYNQCVQLQRDLVNLLHSNNRARAALEVS